MFHFHINISADMAKVLTRLDEQTHLTKLLIDKVDIIMSNVKNIKDEFAQLKIDTEAERAEVQAALGELKTTLAEHIELIKQLRDEIANGGSASEQDLLDILNSAKEARQAVKDISEPLNTEPTEPTEPTDPQNPTDPEASNT